MSIHPTKKRLVLPAAGLLAGTLLAGLGFLGCAGLGLDQVIERPTVHLTNAQVTGVSLRGADLRFEFEVGNPNQVGLNLAGLGYDLTINGERFATGDRSERLRLEAGEETRVELPLTVRFADIYRAYESLRDRDRSSYELAAEFRFDVPVLGRVRVPVTEEGELPLGEWLRSGRRETR